MMSGEDCVKGMRNAALILIDVQRDFLPGGALAVPGGDEIIPEIAKAAKMFDLVILTQDWHPDDHLSFASSHDGKAPFDTVTLPYGEQVLWPDHCVRGDRGSEIVLPRWVSDKASAVIRKGGNRQIDSYSAFFENDRKTATGLSGLLRNRGVRDVYLAGLALDYCVGYSALDAAREGFRTHVIANACRGITPEGSERMMNDMRTAGVRVFDFLQG